MLGSSGLVMDLSVKQIPRDAFLYHMVYNYTT